MRYNLYKKTQQIHLQLTTPAECIYFVAHNNCHKKNFT